jgi:DNA repair protein RadA/Sms
MKSVFVCQNCGYESPKWLGRCPSCQEWNSLAETQKIEPANRKGSRRPAAAMIGLDKISLQEKEKTPTGFEELDRVLGGGLVAGGVVLLAGEPGIGKSTLLLQMAACYSQRRQSAKSPRQSLLYVCGEESPSQIKLRANRLGFLGQNLMLLPETDVDAVIQSLEKEKPALVIVDSIQTMTTACLAGSAGSVGQVKECAGRLISWAKGSQTPLFLVGHVTKEGAIAGPKILEHAVDTVIYFEGEPYGQIRLLRDTKNRFGPTGEVGILKMEGKGLAPVKEAAAAFLTPNGVYASGAARTMVLEGSRPLVLEIQAIVTPSYSPSPRRLAQGISWERLELMTAILQKHLRLPLYKEDVILNVAGGIRVEEPGIDLACCLALWSSYKNKVISPQTIAFGEVGLLGEVRPGREEERRIKEAKRLGYQEILSSGNIHSLTEAIGFLNQNGR